MIERSQLEANPAIRYGWYLRPDAAMSRAQVEIHHLLERQFGMIGGGVFMPHATLKGFFRSDAPLAEIEDAFNRALRGHGPFPVWNGGMMDFHRDGVSIDIHHMPYGTVNEPLQRLHESGWNEIEPLIHPDCEFSPREGKRQNFFAHLTLSMSDLSEDMFDEVWAYLQELRPVGPQVFMAEYVHLYAFRSDDWAGAWWHSLEWALLKSWRLEG